MIREARERLGLTRDEFALILGVTKMTMSRWESGINAPTAYRQRLIRSFKPLRDTKAFLKENGPVETLVALLRK